MKFCQSHWDSLRTAIEERGLSKFVARNGQIAIDRVKGELSGQSPKETFDPLMGAHWGITNNALQMGGLYLMTGDYCPICESEKHGGYPAEWWITNAANEQLGKARELGLVPKDQ